MRKETLNEANNMTWFQIIKSRWEFDADKGKVGESRLKESRIWEEMENPEEMKNFILNEQLTHREFFRDSMYHYGNESRIKYGESKENFYNDLIHLDLKDKTYIGFDKFITDFKKLFGSAWKHNIMSTYQISLSAIPKEENGISNQIHWAIIEIARRVAIDRDYPKTAEEYESYNKEKNKEIRDNLFKLIKEHCTNVFFNKIKKLLYPEHWKRYHPKFSEDKKTEAWWS